MIDIQCYRDSENLAKNNLPTWVFQKNYNLEIFEKEGFPIRINNIQQTRQIFDTMQEHRFDAFMDEIGGFSSQDASIFINACIENIKFQQAHYPTHKSFIPFDTMIGAFLIFSKLNALKPKARQLLEIGPGSAALSFFLKYFNTLQDYTYTDACESFYMLQNNINFFLFKGNFYQHVLENTPDYHYINQKSKQYIEGSLEDRHIIDKIEEDGLKCKAYPWWKLGKLNDSDLRYDLVTSNANLLEFSEGALNDYLSIIHNKLKKDGILFVQCVGYSLLRDFNYLLKKLKEYEFAILLLTGGKVAYRCGRTQNQIEKLFILPNLVIIKKGHPMYEEAYNKTFTGGIIQSNIEEIDKIFFPDTACGKHKFTKQKLLKMILENLKHG